MTPHREVFSRLVDELNALLWEIAARRATAGRDVERHLGVFDQMLEMSGAREWPGLLAANDEGITQWHVEWAETMVLLASRTAAYLRGPTPTPPHAQAMGAGLRR